MNRMQKSLPFLGCLVVAVWSFIWNSHTPKADAAQTVAPNANSEIAALQTEVNRLKGIVPDESHAMKDVAYHFANLWFAGEKKNWPLAEFYWSETRSHLQWAVRIIPVRKDPQGHEIRLAEILAPIESGSLEQLHKAIKEKNSENFTTTYKQLLDSCYACHLGVGKALPQTSPAATARSSYGQLRTGLKQAGWDATALRCSKLESALTTED